MHWLFLRTIQSGHCLLPFDLPPPCVPVPLCVPSSLISGLRSKHKFDAIDSNQILHLHQTLICHLHQASLQDPPSTFPESHLSPLLWSSLFFSPIHSFPTNPSHSHRLVKTWKMEPVTPKKLEIVINGTVWIISGLFLFRGGEIESVETWPHR